MMPRCSRSRSSRSDSNRSSFRAFAAILLTRSSASSCGRSSSVCSSVSAEPRIEVRGVRRSCETASRNVFFISSSARRRCAASRSRRNASEYFRSLRRSACSARLRSVMSIISPRSCRGPCEARTTCTMSRIQIVRPSGAVTRYSRFWSSPASAARRAPAIAPSRSSAIAWSPHRRPSVIHSCSFAPRSCSARPPMNESRSEAASASQKTASRLATSSWNRSSSERRRAFPRASDVMSAIPRASRRSCSVNGASSSLPPITIAPKPSGSQCSGADQEVADLAEQPELLAGWSPRRRA